MFKRIFLFVLTLAMALGVTACGEKSFKDKDIEDFSSSDLDGEKTTLNPFDNLQYTITGISPYCKIAINDQKCSHKVQRFINYSFDKEAYANGETVVVTASLSYSGSLIYRLSRTTHEFKVLNQPEYIESVSEIDASSIENELNDYILAGISAAKNGKVFFNINLFSSEFDKRVISDIDQSRQAVYFSDLKKIKKSKISGNTPYNKYSFIYKMVIESNDGSTEVATVNFSAHNVVKYPDGTLMWGVDSIEDYDFSCVGGFESVEDCIVSSVMTDSINYNISRIN